MMNTYVKILFSILNLNDVNKINILTNFFLTSKVLFVFQNEGCLFKLIFHKYLILESSDKKTLIEIYVFLNTLKHIFTFCML